MLIVKNPPTKACLKPSALVPPELSAVLAVAFVTGPGVRIGETIA
jgi:hypothetical protein